MKNVGLILLGFWIIGVIKFLQFADTLKVYPVNGYGFCNDKHIFP
jgi:hypothetical protein